MSPAARAIDHIRRDARSVIAYSLSPVLGLVSGPILARVLAPVGRGDLAAVLQPITIAGVIAAFGVPSAATFFVARGYSQSDVNRLALLSSGVLGVILYTASIPYMIIVSRNLAISTTVLLLAWLAIPASGLAAARRGVWQGAGNWRVLDSERASYALLRFALVAVLAIVGVTSFIPYIAVSLVAFALAALLLWLWPPADLHLPITQPWNRTARTLFLAYSTKSAAGAIALAANNRVDQLLMPATSSSYELGIYAIAVTVAEVPLVIATIAGRNLLHAASAGVPPRALVRVALPSLGMTVLATAALAIATPWVVPAVFGPAFNASVASTEILLVGTILNSIAICTTALLSGRGRPGFASLTNVLGTIVVLALFALLWLNITSDVASWINLASQGATAIAGVSVLLLTTKSHKA